jgi:hypothetical protein
VPGRARNGGLQQVGLEYGLTICRIFLDPKRVVRESGSLALVLSLMTLVATELAVQQFYFAYPPFRNVGRDDVSSRIQDGPRVTTGASDESQLLDWGQRGYEAWRLSSRRVATAVVWITGWFGVGLVASRRPRSARAVAAAVVCATAVLSAGQVTRIAFLYLTGVDPGLFGFPGLTSAHSGLLAALSQITVFEMWSSVALALGLSEAWRRPFPVLLPYTIGTLVVVKLVPAAGDPAGALAALAAGLGR